MQPADFTLITKDIKVGFIIKNFCSQTLFFNTTNYLLKYCLTILLFMVHILGKYIMLSTTMVWNDDEWMEFNLFEILCPW